MKKKPQYDLLAEYTALMAEILPKRKTANTAFETAKNLHAKNNADAKVYIAFYQRCIADAEFILPRIRTIIRIFKQRTNLKEFSSTMVPGFETELADILIMAAKSYICLKNSQEAILLIQEADKLDKNGSIRAKLDSTKEELGDLFYIAGDYDKAYSYLKEIKPSRFWPAMDLACIFYYGSKSIQQDKPKAFTYYQMAGEFAMQQRLEANCYEKLALFFEEEGDENFNKDKVLIYSRRGAELGILGAQIKYAERLLKSINAEGLIGKRDEPKIAEAKKWLGTVLKQNERLTSESQIYMKVDLAKLLVEGDAKEQKQAYTLFVEAANTGNKEAQNIQAFCLYKGFGVSKNIPEAEIIFLRLQNDEHPPIKYLANLALGDICFYTANYTQAAFYYKKSVSTRNNFFAIYKLIILYEFGLGVETNSDMVKHWVNEAVKFINDPNIASSCKITIQMKMIQFKMANPPDLKDSKFDTPATTTNASALMDFEKLNQTLKYITDDRTLYQDEKIRSLFAQISLAQTFNHTNLVTALMGIGKCFNAINNHPTIINQYVEQTKLLLSRLEDQLPRLDELQISRVFEALSKLHINPEEKCLHNIIEFSLNKFTQPAILPKFTAQNLERTLSALARMDWDIAAREQISAIIQEVLKRLIEFSIDELIRLTYAFALLDVYQREKNIVLFKPTIVRKVFATLKQKLSPEKAAGGEEQTPEEKEKKPVVSASHQHQFILALNYFSQQHSAIKLPKIPFFAKDDQSEAESKSKPKTKASKTPMTRFQRNWTDFIGARLAKPGEMKLEVEINGLPPDVQLPYPDGRIVQMNGPNHFVYLFDAKSKPKPSRKHQFHDALHRLTIGKTTIHIDFFEADPLTTPEEKCTYLHTKNLDLPLLPKVQAASAVVADKKKTKPIGKTPQIGLGLSHTLMGASKQKRPKKLKLQASPDVSTAAENHSPKVPGS